MRCTGHNVDEPAYGRHVVIVWVTRTFYGNDIRI